MMQQERVRLEIDDQPQDPAARWLEQRLHPDLPEACERAIRLAGLSWTDEAAAERYLAEAAALAPNHMAVTIAHYRYHFYKHHYSEAVGFAEDCLAALADKLKLPRDFRRVTPFHADFLSDDPTIRFWLWAMQAYGYVLFRLGRPEGVEVLEKVAELDQNDVTRTRVLLIVIAQGPGDEDDED